MNTLPSSDGLRQDTRAEPCLQISCPEVKRRKDTRVNTINRLPYYLCLDLCRLYNRCVESFGRCHDIPHSTDTHTLPHRFGGSELFFKQYRYHGRSHECGGCRFQQNPLLCPSCCRDFPHRRGKSFKDPAAVLCAHHAPEPDGTESRHRLWNRCSSMHGHR